MFRQRIQSDFVPALQQSVLMWDDLALHGEHQLVEDFTAHIKKVSKHFNLKMLHLTCPWDSSAC